MPKGERKGLAREDAVSAYLDIPRDTLKRWRYRGGMGPKWVKVGPRAVRYRWSDVDAWLESQASDGRPAA